MTELHTIPVPDAAPELPHAEASAQPATPSTFAEAGAALKAQTSWGEPQADATATSPAEAPVTPEATEPQPDAFAAFSVDAEGRLHRPDGTFADAAEVEAYNASVTAAEQPDSVTESATDEAPAPVLATVRTRDGREVEIEVTDPEIAEAINANRNDGMRREEFRRRMEGVEQKEAEVREFVAMLETNPEAVILQHLPQDKQVKIATALIAQHWDAIYDQLLGFEQDPTARIKTAMDTQIAIRDQQSDYDKRVQATRHAAEISRSVSQLIPEGVPSDVETQFWADAQHDLVRAAQSGQPVTPETVADLLAPRLRLYAPLWGEAKAGAPQAPEPPKRPLARPVAKPSASTAAPASVSATGNAGATVRRAVVAQRVAAAVPPVGAGAAPLSRPVLPANATLADAVAAARKQRTWTPVGS